MAIKKRVCVLHGGIRNAGDFLILESGKKLLEEFLGEYFEFFYEPRFKRIKKNNFDGIIILGGPLINRTLYQQARNVVEFIKDKDVPVFCLGLGISGKKFTTYETYFQDEDSIIFWKNVYKSSYLFSVRDIKTYKVLKSYGIDAELTGCPALAIDRSQKTTPSKHINKILVSIPNLRIFMIKDFLLTFYLLYSLKRKFDKKEIGVVFQHGFSTFLLHVIRYICILFGMEAYDLSHKSIDAFEKLSIYDLHVGTRLHLHIYFLTLKKPSILLSVDMRTRAFLDTINTPNDDFAYSGIKKMLNFLKENERNILEYFIEVTEKIKQYRDKTEKFLNEIKLFYKNENKDK